MSGPDSLQVLREEIAKYQVDREVNSSLLVRILLFNYRFGHGLYRMQLPNSLQSISGLIYKMLFNLIIIPLGGGGLDRQTEIGAGLKLAHRMNGIVIHSGARIGNKVTLYHQVTIGRSKYLDGSPLVPNIGDEVVIYPGAKVIGDITVGNRSIIGANAVVVENVPENGVCLAPKAKLQGE